MPNDVKPLVWQQMSSLPIAAMDDETSYAGQQEPADVFRCVFIINSFVRMKEYDNRSVNSKGRRRRRRSC